MNREAFAYIQVELIVEYGEGKRTEDEARAIVNRARAFAKTRAVTVSARPAPPEVSP